MRCQFTSFVMLLCCHWQCHFRLVRGAHRNPLCCQSNGTYLILFGLHLAKEINNHFDWYWCYRLDRWEASNFSLLPFARFAFDRHQLYIAHSQSPCLSVCLSFCCLLHLYIGVIIEQIRFSSLYSQIISFYLQSIACCVFQEICLLMFLITFGESFTSLSRTKTKCYTRKHNCIKVYQVSSLSRDKTYSTGFRHTNHQIPYLSIYWIEHRYSDWKSFDFGLSWFVVCAAVAHCCRSKLGRFHNSHSLSWV